MQYSFRNSRRRPRHHPSSGARDGPRPRTRTTRLAQFRIPLTDSTRNRITPSNRRQRNGVSLEAEVGVTGRRRDRTINHHRRAGHAGSKQAVDPERIQKDRAEKRAGTVHAAVRGTPPTESITHELIAAVTGLPLGILRWEYPTIDDLTRGLPGSQYASKQSLRPQSGTPAAQKLIAKEQKP